MANQIITPTTLKYESAKFILKYFEKSWSMKAYGEL